jgi:hypothetical protein
MKSRHLKFVSVPVNYTVNYNVNAYIESRDEAEHRLNIDDLYRISRSDLSYLIKA